MKYDIKIWFGKKQRLNYHQQRVIEKSPENKRKMTHLRFLVYPVKDYIQRPKHHALL